MIVIAPITIRMAAKVATQRATDDVAEYATRRKTSTTTKIPTALASPESSRFGGAAWPDVTRDGVGIFMRRMVSGERG